MVENEVEFVTFDVIAALSVLVVRFKFYLLEGVSF